MTSILNPRTTERRGAVGEPLEALTPESQAPEAAPGEFEIVMGRMQVASVLFVATVVLVLFSALSYLAGKASTPKPGAVSRVQVPAAVPVPVVQVAAPEPAKFEPVKSDPMPELPVFAEPVQGAVYLQMGAVDRGMAAIFVEGLRMRAFRAFAARGPNDKIFRVLIGPIPDPQAFLRTQGAVDQIGLSTFAR